jgi:hypothetical protein
MGYGKYFTKTPDQYLRELLHIGDPNADDNVKGLKWNQVTDGAPHLNTPTVPYVPFFDKSSPRNPGGSSSTSSG